MRWKRVVSGVLTGLLLFGLAGCAAEQPQETIANETETELIAPIAFVSDANVRFKKQEDTYEKVYPSSELDESTGTIIEVDLENEKQTIDGFGASFTDAATYLFESLPEETRKDVMTKLFDDEKGIGLDMIRNPLGACDFSL